MWLKSFILPQKTNPLSNSISKNSVSLIFVSPPYSFSDCFQGVLRSQKIYICASYKMIFSALLRPSMGWLLDWQARRINQKAFHQVFTISPSHNQQWKYNLDINYAFYPSPLGRNYNQRILSTELRDHSIITTSLLKTFLRIVLCHFLRLTWAGVRNVIFPETYWSWPMFSEAASLPFLFPFPVVCVNSLLSRSWLVATLPPTQCHGSQLCMVWPALATSSKI